MTVKELKEALANANQDAPIDLSYYSYQSFHGLQREERVITNARSENGKLVLLA